MKKIVFVIIILLVTITLTSCFPYKIRGISEFNVGNSSVTICEKLLPNEGFSEKFNSFNKDYLYYYAGYNFDLRMYESALMYFQYDKETYALAKNEMLNLCILSQETQFNYNEYNFYRNITDLNETYEKLNGFPYEFNMIAYNDTLNTLVFMGFRISKHISNEKEEEIFEFNDFGLFLKEYFWFYDFNLNTPQITD